ncbi:hypothetical protein HPB47_013025, partial [Ixodes persulcatus]
TSNAKLASLGLHNTYAELAEAQLLNQLERLTKSPTGRNLLAKLGYDCFLRGSEDIEILNDQIRNKITETAIALAASASRGRDSVTIITDSQQACRNYAKGQIYKAAAAVLRKGTNLPKEMNARTRWLEVCISERVSAQGRKMSKN